MPATRQPGIKRQDSKHGAAGRANSVENPISQEEASHDTIASSRGGWLYRLPALPNHEDSRLLSQDRRYQIATSSGKQEEHAAFHTSPIK